VVGKAQTVCNDLDPNHGLLPGVGAPHLDRADTVSEMVLTVPGAFRFDESLVEVRGRQTGLGTPIRLSVALIVPSWRWSWREKSASASR